MKNGQKISVIIVFCIGVIYLIVRFMTKKTSRGIKNNNPFNLAKSTIQWNNEIKGTDPKFCSFLTLEAGLRAGLINLYNGYFSQGLTVMQIVDKYAPASDNNENNRNYVDFICKYTGLASFSIPDPADYLKVAWAILYFENGIQVKSISDLEAIAKNNTLVYYV
jgi:hypothetical protein